MRALSLLATLALLGGCVSAKQIARSDAKIDLGAAYYREGDLEGSIATLREAARLNPKSWRALNALAVAYIAKGQIDLADDTFQKARRVSKGEEAEVLNNHGTLLLKTGRTEEAIAAFTAGLEDLDYRNPAMIHSNLSFALLQAGRTDEALRHAREATRRAPNLCEAWYHLGLVQEKRSDALAALEAYQQVRQICPEDALGARLRSACIQVEVGASDDGVAALQDIVRAAPGTAFADQARACLRTVGP